MGMTAHSGEMPQEYSRGVSRWEPTRGSGRDRFRMRLVPSADATMSPAHRGSDVRVGAVTGHFGKPMRAASQNQPHLMSTEVSNSHPQANRVLLGGSLCYKICLSGDSSLASPVFGGDS